MTDSIFDRPPPDHDERVRKCLALAAGTSFDGERIAALNRAWKIIIQHDLTPGDYDFPLNFIPVDEDIDDFKACFDYPVDASDFLNSIDIRNYRTTPKYELPRSWFVPGRMHPELSDLQLIDLAEEHGWDRSTAKVRTRAYGHNV